MLRANYVHWGSGAHNSGLEMFKFFSRLGSQLLVWAHNSGWEMFQVFVASGPTTPFLATQFWMGNVQVFRLEWSGLGLHRGRRVRVECGESRDDEAARCGPEHSEGALSGADWARIEGGGSE